MINAAQDALRRARILVQLQDGTISRESEVFLHAICKDLLIHFCKRLGGENAAWKLVGMHRKTSPPFTTFLESKSDAKSDFSWEEEEDISNHLIFSVARTHVYPRSNHNLLSAQILSR